MGSSCTASLLRRGLVAACRAALLTEVADVVSWDVEGTRACAAGSAAEPNAPRFITGCWLGIAHHFLGVGVHDCISGQPSTVQTYAKPSPVGRTTINGRRSP